MTRLAFVLLIFGCSGSTGPMMLDDASVLDDAEVMVDAGVLDDAEVMADAGIDALPEDSGVDAFVVEDGGTDSGPPDCGAGVLFRDRCVFTVRSRTDEEDPCPLGARRLRWSDREEQVALQSAIGALEVSSGATSLRRYGRTGAWIWDDNTPPPPDLLWASTPSVTLPNAYLNGSGLNAYHREYAYTFCERRF